MKVRPKIHVFLQHVASKSAGAGLAEGVGTCTKDQGKEEKTAPIKKTIKKKRSDSDSDSGSESDSNFKTKQKHKPVKKRIRAAPAAAAATATATAADDDDDDNGVIKRKDVQQSENQEIGRSRAKRSETVGQ